MEEITMQVLNSDNIVDEVIVITSDLDDVIKHLDYWVTLLSNNMLCRDVFR